MIWRMLTTALFLFCFHQQSYWKISFETFEQVPQNFKLLKPCQFGFCASSSANLTLLSLTDFLNSSIGKGNCTESVFLDFTKAFDTISHNILFSKLESLGIAGPSLTFIKNYLLDREQSVRIGGINSNDKIINQGVPQGSILGPLLFCIYINDLPDYLDDYKVILYADDMTISILHKSLTTLINTLNKELTNVVEWCHLNNCFKPTQFMVFKTSRKNATFHTTSVHWPSSHSCIWLCVFSGHKIRPLLEVEQHLV